MNTQSSATVTAAAAVGRRRKSNDSTQCFLPQRKHHTMKEFENISSEFGKPKSFIFNEILVSYNLQYTAGMR